MTAPQSALPQVFAGMRLKLYVVGRSARSQLAIDNLRRLLLLGPLASCDVEVVDVLEAPERAERERILATPTLLREFPPPRRRVTGDLSDLAHVARILGAAGGASLVDGPPPALLAERRDE